MPRDRDPSTPIFQFVDVDAAEAPRFPDALRAMIDRELDGIVLRGLLPRAAVEAASARLDQRAFPRVEVGGPAPGVYAVGRAIVGAAPDMAAYFADAPDQRQRVRELFAGHADFEATIAGALSRLAGGLPAEVAPGPDGHVCPAATIRVLPEGGEIGVHVDNAYLHMPQASHLRTVLDTTDQLSFFVPLSVPEAGGELVVFGLEWAAVKLFMPPAVGTAANVWYEGSEMYQLVSSMESVAFTPRPGDLLVFDGGRYFHRISKVVGPVPRKTIGGFLGLSRRRDRVYFWS